MMIKRVGLVDDRVCELGGLKSQLGRAKDRAEEALLSTFFQQKDDEQSNLRSFTWGQTTGGDRPSSSCGQERCGCGARHLLRRW